MMVQKMKKLIINADDFGLHTLVNNGIIRGYENGLITSTSIMPSGKAFEDAAALALAHPELGIGVHLTLVAEHTLTDPAMIPSLTDAEGCMPANYGKFLLRFVQGEIALKDIRLELMAQIEKAIAAGINVTHLDSHQHLHVFPGIIDIVLDLARQYGIKAMRIPDEPYLFLQQRQGALPRVLARNGLTFLARLARKKAVKSGIAVPQHFFGMLSGGNMAEASLVQIIKQLPPGISEIMMHPGLNNEHLNAVYGWQYHWQNELQAVMSPAIRQFIKINGIQMISFGELQ